MNDQRHTLNGHSPFCGVHVVACSQLCIRRLDILNKTQIDCLRHILSCILYSLLCYLALYGMKLPLKTVPVQ